MYITPIKVEQYVAWDGKKPFQEWLNNLKDLSALEKIYRRLARLETGNLGDHKFVLLLIGGTKKTQPADIETAKRYWEDYRNRTSGKRTV